MINQSRVHIIMLGARVAVDEKTDYTILTGTTLRDVHAAIGQLYDEGDWTSLQAAAQLGKAIVSLCVNKGLRPLG